MLVGMVRAYTGIQNTSQSIKTRDWKQGELERNSQVETVSENIRKWDNLSLVSREKLLGQCQAIA